MKKIEIDEQLLRSLYCDEMKSAKECAHIFGVSDNVIRRRLIALGITIRTTKFYNCDKSVNDDQIIDLYWGQKLSISETASRLGKSSNFIKQRLKKSGAGTRSVSEGSRLWRESDEISDEQLINLYNNCGWSCEKISSYFNKSEEFVRQRFRRINKKRRRNTGKYNGSWKGGTTPISVIVRSGGRTLEWRKRVFKQYGWKSAISGIRANICHHIYPFHTILKSSVTKHRPLDGSEYFHIGILNDQRFYDDDNGLPLTDEEHDRIESSNTYAHPWWKIWSAYPDFALSRSKMNFSTFDDNGQILATNYEIHADTSDSIKQIIRYEHYLGTVPKSTIILTAKRMGIVIGIATFGKGANKNIRKDALELTRLCIPFYVKHPFGCEFISRCCGYIKNNYLGINRLISYADSSVGHNGGIYRIAGWTKAGHTPESYAYFDQKNSQLRHKSCCRRIKGVDKTEKQLAGEKLMVKIPLGTKYKYIYDLYCV